MGSFAEPSHAAPPTRAPALAPRPAQPASAPLSRNVEDPRLLSTSDTASLLLRDTTSTMLAALGTTGSARRSALTEAALGFSRASRELVQLDALYPVGWPRHLDELTAMSSAASGLATELARLDMDPVSGIVSKALIGIEVVVDAKTWKQSGMGGARVPTALSSTEQGELARHAIAAARRQAGVFLATKSRDRDTAAALCAPIRSHIHAAEDAALKVVDHRERAALTDDIRQLSADLDDVAQILSMAKAVEWHEVLASMFDAENQLRTVLGLPRLMRPYTGTSDPAQAKKAIEEFVQHGTLPDLKPTDSSTAANVVCVRLSSLHQERMEEVGRLQSDLKEPPPPPKDPGVFDTILDIAVSTAFATVTGAVGGLVADRVKKALEKAHGKAVAKQLENLPEELRAKSKADLTAIGSIGRAVTADAAKDGSKQLFKDLADNTKKFVTSAKPKARTNSSDPMNSFFQLHVKALGELREALAVQLPMLLPLLARLDLALLIALGDELRDLKRPIAELEYGNTLREWQNFRVGLNSEKLAANSKDPLLDGDPNWRGREDAINGAIEVGVEVDPDPTSRVTRFRYLTLRGGEVAAFNWLKRSPQAIDKFHRQVFLYFGFNGASMGRYIKDATAARAESGIVKVGIGRSDGFQAGSLGKTEISILKAYLDGDATTGEVLAAPYRSYDVSDSSAVEAARQLVATVPNLTTERLEKPDA